MEFLYRDPHDRNSLQAYACMSACACLIRIIHNALNLHSHWMHDIAHRKSSSTLLFCDMPLLLWMNGPEVIGDWKTCKKPRKALGSCNEECESLKASGGRAMCACTSITPHWNQCCKRHSFWTCTCNCKPGLIHDRPTGVAVGDEIYY